MSTADAASVARIAVRRPALPVHGLDIAPSPIASFVIARPSVRVAAHYPESHSLESPTMRSLEFWYDFASTYSYLSAMRIETLAQASGVTVAWKPFLLGPIFQAQGWTSSPFNIYPAKGRYMIRDIERLSAERGLVFHSPTPFPQNSLLPARLALALAPDGPIAAFTRAVYQAQFAHGLQLDDRAALGTILESLRLDSARFFDLSAASAVKDALKAQTAQAQSYGIFGAPTFRTADGELFWGDDRLEQAIAHATKA
jgi:2-hydroxychromene-2-carboxylate isomerase